MLNAMQQKRMTDFRPPVCNLTAVCEPPRGITAVHVGGKVSLRIWTSQSIGYSTETRPTCLHVSLLARVPLLPDPEVRTRRPGAENKFRPCGALSFHMPLGT